MPRVDRTPYRKDYSSLMREFKRAKNTEPVVQKEQELLPIPSPATVTDARRRRDRLMGNLKMLYAYSSLTHIIHDRDCEYARNIPDDCFNMSEVFLPNLRRCRSCYRRALIRAGIGDDRKRMHAYEIFFDRIGATDQELYYLTVVNRAKLYCISGDEMQIAAGEDTWQIVYNRDGLDLYHNNYIILPDLSRYFKENFHKQNEKGSLPFYLIMRIMFNYSWDEHLQLAQQKLILADLLEDIRKGPSWADDQPRENRSLSQPKNPPQKAAPKPKPAAKAPEKKESANVYLSVLEEIAEERSQNRAWQGETV